MSALPSAVSENASCVIGAHAISNSTAVEVDRSEEHTSELQSRLHLVCRLLLEKKKTKTRSATSQPPPTQRRFTMTPAIYPEPPHAPSRRPGGPTSPAPISPTPTPSALMSQLRG